MSGSVKAEFEVDSLDDIIIRRKIVRFQSLLHAGKDELGTTSEKLDASGALSGRRDVTIRKPGLQRIGSRGVLCSSAAFM